MTWTVVWTPSPLDDLATIWMNASDRNSVSRASNLIDDRLRRDPYSDSESRDDNTRIMIEPPLGIYYEVSDEDCMVTVRGVWRFN